MQDAHAALNASLNAVSGVLLFAGWRAVRGGNVGRHKRLMLAALGVSAVFLASYVARFVLAQGPNPYPDVGWTRTAYLVVLTSHSLLAAFVPFLALRVVWLAWKERIDAHRRLARITFPIWIYVSVTGVVVYAMRYHLAPVLEAA